MKPAFAAQTANSAESFWSDDLHELLDGYLATQTGVPLFAHRQVRRGQRLTRGGQDFESLYLVNAGWFKSVYVDENGVEQVMGFWSRGDLIGADGIGSGQYLNEAEALSVADVVVIPFARSGDFAEFKRGLETTLLQIVSRQMVHNQMAMVAISTLPAPARLARFLLSKGERMARWGYSATDFELAMSRQDIASYLGMTIETVSRALGRFAKQGVIRVAQRHIVIVDSDGLHELATPRSASDEAGDLADQVSQVAGGSPGPFPVV